MTDNTSRGCAYLTDQNPNDIFHIYNNKNTQVKTQEDLDLIILVIYDYLKKGIRHSDNGYANFDTGMPISNLQILEQKFQKTIQTKIPTMDEIFKKHFHYLKDEGQQSFEYLLFELSYIIRHYDGNNYHNIIEDDDADEADYNMDDDLDYPKMQVLKQIYKKDIPNINFLSGVLDIVLPRETQCINRWVVVDIENVYISDYFRFIYLLLVEVVEI